MSTDEFRCRMYYDICSVFQRTDQERCRKCGIHYQWNIVCMGYFCNCFNINQVGIWISQCLDKDCFGIFLNGCFKGTFYFRIYKRCGNSGCQWQSMRQQIGCSAVDRLCCYDMFTGFCQCLECIGNCCCSRCYSQCCHFHLPVLRYVLQIRSRSGSSVFHRYFLHLLNRNLSAACCELWNT